MAGNPFALCEPVEGIIQDALEVDAYVAELMTSAAHLKKGELKQWFLDGRLPCSSSLQPFWEPIRERLDHFDEALANKMDALTTEQQEREKASQDAELIRQEIYNLRSQLSEFEKKERIHAQNLKTLEEELEDYQRLDVGSLKAFAQSASEMEKELVSQLEAQLAKDKGGLFALNKQGSPKLALLLNCFGADAETIKAVRHLNSNGLISQGEDALTSWVLRGLPRDQQIVVLYTRERLQKGKFPFWLHDCALCDCETAEEMASFLNENGLTQVTADTISQTGASGRGALLFLTIQDLQLGTKDQKALMMSRQYHREN